MTRVIILLILALAHGVSSKCPTGSVQGVNAEDCFFFNAVPTMWLKAEETCITRGGHLASVSGVVVNSVLQQISSLSCAKEFWLGGSWDTQLPGQWTWTDGRRFSYTNWAPGQPTNSEYYCVAIDVSSGRWYSRPCDTTKPFICKVPPVTGGLTTSTPSGCPSCPAVTCPGTGTPATSTMTGTPRTSCPSGWTFVAQAEGKCLKLTADRLEDWGQLRAECQQIGGDLASIHSNSSNYAVREFVFNALNMGNDDFEWPAIGLYDPKDNGNYQWTDGSAVTYTNWQQGDPIGEGSTGTYLGVYGTDVSDYADRNGVWEADDSASAPWYGVCQL